MRVFAISDVHSDMLHNWSLLEKMPADYQDDLIIVAGDISHNIKTIEKTLKLFKRKFRYVCYTPGNHELWVRDESYHSLEKFNKIIDLCNKFDIYIQPLILDQIAIVPLYSWYESSFDLDDAKANIEELVNWSDNYFCRWPKETKNIAQYFLQLNNKHIKEYQTPVISFSHFLPRRELLPDKKWLYFKALPKVAGCIDLDEQIRYISAQVHVFGHSHINYDIVIDNIRYVQNAMGYPRERNLQEVPLKLIWETANQNQ